MVENEIIFTSFYINFIFSYLLFNFKKILFKF